MKKFEFALACKATNHGLARIALHILALIERKESWVRAKAGICRELHKSVRLM